MDTAKAAFLGFLDTNWTGVRLQIEFAKKILALDINDIAASTKNIYFGALISYSIVDNKIKN
jgi:hypothetical protein